MDQQEKLVWDRVLQPRLPGWESALQEQTEALADCYWVLGHKQLHALGLQAIRLLRGIARLEGWDPGRYPRGGRKGPPGAVDYISCYRRCRELMTAWALRGPRPETGMLYRQLEQLTMDQCRLLAEALGGAPETTKTAAPSRGLCNKKRGEENEKG